MKQEDYTKTERMIRDARAAKAKPVPRGQCCNTVVVASWEPEGANPEIFDRHTGSRCAGIEEPVNFKEWYRGRRN